MLVKSIYTRGTGLSACSGNLDEVFHAKNKHVHRGCSHLTEALPSEMDERIRGLVLLYFLENKMSVVSQCFSHPFFSFCVEPRIKFPNDEAFAAAIKAVNTKDTPAGRKKLHEELKPQAVPLVCGVKSVGTGSTLCVDPTKLAFTPEQSKAVSTNLRMVTTRNSDPVVATVIDTLTPIKKQEHHRIIALILSYDYLNSSPFEGITDMSKWIDAGRAYRDYEVPNRRMFPCAFYTAIVPPKCQEVRLWSECNTSGNASLRFIWTDSSSASLTSRVNKVFNPLYMYSPDPEDYTKELVSNFKITDQSEGVGLLIAPMKYRESPTRGVSSGESHSVQIRYASAAPTEFSKRRDHWQFIFFNAVRSKGEVPTNEDYDLASERCTMMFFQYRAALVEHDLSK